MKVSNVNNIFFKGTLKKNDTEQSPVIKNTTVPLTNITPEYNIKVPQKYTLTAVNKLNNGLEIYQYKLANGYKVSIVPMEGAPAIVKTYVNVGAMNETPDIKGISHFLEHMAFNGTKGENNHVKLETGDSFKKIDEIGGWTNASTNYAITDYVNSTPLLEEKDIETQIKILSAMNEDLKLSEDMIKKEKGPVSSEINMILDDPKTIAMDQTVRTLFNIKNPADELVGGSVAHIQNLTRKDVLDYYNKYYTPDNTNIVITGDINPQKVIDLVSKNFVSNKISKGKKYEEKLNPIKNTVRKDFKSDKAKETEIVIGFAGAKNNNSREQILYELATTYLNSHFSGLTQNLKKYNTYPMIADDKISTNPSDNRLGYIALSTTEDKCEDVLKIIFRQLSKKDPIDNEKLEILKQKLINNNEEFAEHSLIVNSTIGQSILDNNIEYVTQYDKIVNSITAEELNSAIRTFFDTKKAAITVIHPENNNTPSFKAKNNRQPVNLSNIETKTLDNNFEIGFYKTKANKVNVNMQFSSDKPYAEKAGVASVLNEIYSMGIKDKMNEDQLSEYLEKNNLNIRVSNNQKSILTSIDGNKNNYEKGIKIAKEILYNPAITEENLEKAKRIVKDNIERTADTSSLLFHNYDAKNSPYYFTNDEILNSLDSITLEDVKQCHDYLLNTSNGIVTANIPYEEGTEFKDNIISSINTFKNVKENKYNQLELFKSNDKTSVLTKANNNSQADITETFQFKYNDNIKEIATSNIMNSILSSSSIGLFDNLREKENLAYSVHSNIDKNGDKGNISLNILTTTDNKSINEISYDNLKKSINGFNRQINLLVNGEFTELDLENAKRALKANLLNKEGTNTKLNSLYNGITSKYGIEYENKLFDEIDNISKEDVTNYAKYVFSNKPVYSITASQDTLNNNKEFLEKLSNENVLKEI